MWSLSDCSELNASNETWILRCQRYAYNVSRVVIIARCSLSCLCNLLTHLWNILVTVRVLKIEDYLLGGNLASFCRSYTIELPLISCYPTTQSTLRNRQCFASERLSTRKLSTSRPLVTDSRRNREIKPFAIIDLELSLREQRFLRRVAANTGRDLLPVTWEPGK